MSEDALLVLIGLVGLLCGLGALVGWWLAGRGLR